MKRLSAEGYFSFEDYEVYHLALDLSAQVYRLTAGFPEVERFGLTNQLRRAANSIALNIAEGRGRGTDREFARFLLISRGSLFEVVSGFHLAVRLVFLQEGEVREMFQKAHTLSGKLSALVHKLSALGSRPSA
ncbi:four helix bundle protein [Deinococcus roseus]|nr:four helix bundle protein [Deinococcus roseus]